MRIRKRPLTATTSGNPELHESSNGGLHLHACSKSNPNFQGPRSSLLCPASILKQDHLLLARSGYGSTHRLSQKNLPAEGVSLMRKPYIAKSVMDVRHQYEAKHMHIHHGDDNVKRMDMMGCNELELITSGEGDELAEIYKKARHDIACKGSALRQENANAGPAIVDMSDDLGKLRPLQLILSSDDSPTAAPKLPLPLCPMSSSSTLSSTPPPPSRNFDKALPFFPTKTAPFHSPVAGSLIKQNIAVVKSQDEMRLTGNEDASSQNNSDETVTNLVGNRAELESCSLLKIGSDCCPVSSWQGHRRPRSHVQGGRGPNGAPGVNAVFKTENMEQRRFKKPKQTKRKAIDVLVSVQAPIVPATGHGELEMQDCRAAQLVKNKGHTKKTLLPTSTACVFPTSTNMIGFIAAAQSLETKRTATTATHKNDDHVASVAATAPGARTSDNELELGSMRCRRKDGRRWRCKEQVIKAGSPFCHYHTLKMREKHAASVARKLLKQLQGEVKISSDGLSYSEFIRSSNKSRKNRSAPPSSIAVQDGYDGGCKGAEDEGEEENEYNNDGQQKMHAKLGKEQLLMESLTHRRRWRKKCKPCIRRLHDIHDRSRPAATDGVDSFNPEERYEESLLVRSGSPLPECLLNTDPYEWRSDCP